MDDQGSSDPACPFCPFSDPDSNFVAEHVQYCHPENELHVEPGSNIPVAPMPIPGNQEAARSELGPYAYEKRMPSWLLRMLEKGPAATKLNTITTDGKLFKCEVIENQTANVIPALSQLCEQDKSVQRAFFCSAAVHHVTKMPREGGFCGYRNIQMLISYIRQSQSLGYEHFPSLPSIFQLQDMIERAWDMGFNSEGRQETGGIKGTRKYIGTSEAQALLLSLDIQCKATSISKTNEMTAYNNLLSHIAAYFRSACPLDTDKKVILTSLPPIYFQHQGHSLTIVGFEIRDDGSANLLVFDPFNKAPSAVLNTAGAKPKHTEPARLLKAYRRDVNYLQKHKTFELLQLTVPGITPEP
ncbi:hypothetical protein ARAM_000299 [Aspergillus rambellii]|uniref:UFSP1/2/DUB catalytic domain-containing protein n=1 Tax=Aspergillus rambellii TaxID=308745 RepID=A0A0F8V4Q2_9EURO|nr:hypothetical protein ARAM_000299 [Aspergillus rambellii]